MTKEILLAIAGFTSLKAKEVAGEHLLIKGLKISNDRLLFLANRFSKILKEAGSKKWIMATTLQDSAFSVADCVTLMLKKGLDVDVKGNAILELIREARKEL
jgi:hypothetical protein